MFFALIAGAVAVAYAALWFTFPLWMLFAHVAFGVWCCCNDAEER